ncbi:hypothetical protein I4U23_022902 [Adineta vaga]|nr:hypothetical protein I4U23_022902 [Adineta vaga]
MSLVFNDYEDDPSDLSITKAKSRNILIAGLTGSGKSSIIKSIISPDHDSPISKMSICSVTKNLALYGDNKIKDHSPDNKNAEYIVNLFDTVGLGDPDVDVPTILRQIVDATQTDLAKIHKVVFCFKMDRLRAKMSEDLNILYNFFKMVGAHPDNFVICLTFCDILNNETISAFWDELKVHSDLAMVKEVKNVTYTSFPNISECDTNPGIN